MILVPEVVIFDMQFGGLPARRWRLMDADQQADGKRIFCATLQGKFLSQMTIYRERDELVDLRVSLLFQMQYSQV